jgi:hypothetical protein
MSSRLFAVDSPLGFLLPADEEGFLPEAEYVEVLEYAFEEYAGEDSSVEDIVRRSEYLFRITVPGRIVDASGAEVAENRRSVVFRLPLLVLLTLESPVEFSITYATP